MTDDAKSLLFLSCDIVGSTAFKQQQGSLWQKTFLSFYREFPQMLGDVSRAAASCPQFTLWKPVGDELIFTCHVRAEREIYSAVRAWLDAMRQYEEHVFRDVDLATKGGAFIATFPGPDSRSSIPWDPQSETSDKGVVELNDEALESGSPEYLFDFFGPSIDTGFRVLSACSHRYFTLSVEVAWAMAECAAGAAVSHSVSDMVLLGAREFKGVWAGREYPVFAVDRRYDDPVNKALAKIRETKLDADDVVSLCRACSAEARWPSALYLPLSSHAEFKIEPQDSLAEMRSNSMEGAETLPSDVGKDALDADAPLGQQ